MSLTKADIDALVTNMASQNFNPTAAWDALRKALYLAAGLTAEGERKPERTRCWMVSYPDEPNCPRWFGTQRPSDVMASAVITPGWFVPDTESSDAR